MESKIRDRSFRSQSFSLGSLPFVADRSSRPVEPSILVHTSLLMLTGVLLVLIASAPARSASPPATGACCLPGDTCLLLGDFECDAQGGEFAGEGTTCDPTPCFGACCVPTGGCEMYSELECFSQEGEFSGYLEDCVPELCPEGGLCCVPEGCWWLTYDACRDVDGEPLGVEGACQWCRGACCLADGTCLELFEADCDAAGGAFEGILTDCGPESCASADVHEPSARVAPTLSIFPNPASSEVTFMISSQSSRRGRLRLVDTSGRIAWSCTVDAGPGVQEITTPVGNDSGSPVPAGVYYVLVSLGDAQVAGRFVVSR
ncbi:MAG: T9SS type A sorting domain-containing protein [Candidatus Eisenbacteria bacterium]|nr:T9SS type A sorting domain-containing protein [Candidatus Eisenbacteria bacterium]